MKYITVYSLLLLLSVFSVSCQKLGSEALGELTFMRLEEDTIRIAVGESYLIKPLFDSNETAAQGVTWNLTDDTLVNVTSGSNGTTTLVGEKTGETGLEIIAKKGNVTYNCAVVVEQEKKVKILAIGNSFSEDAVEGYLHEIITHSGQKAIVGNMYIGGCTLEKHWTNMKENNNSYEYRKINEDGIYTKETGKSLREVIKSENWDYISFQEVSYLSGKIEGYNSYLPDLVSFVKEIGTNPDLKILLHQPWAYQQNTTHSGFVNYDNDQTTMFTKIVEMVWKAKDLTDIDVIIPTGTAIQNARTSYIGDNLTRDGYHLDKGIGRFIASCTWYETLFGNILDNTYKPENLTKYDTELAKTAAYDAVKIPKKVTEMQEFATPPPNEYVLEYPIYIDFGATAAATPWNNYLTPTSGKLSDLIDEKENNTGFAIQVTGKFNGNNSSGEQENDINIPTEVGKDAFWSAGKSTPNSTFTISNMNKDYKYTLVFYASRGGVSDNRETEYYVQGTNEGKTYINAASNTSEIGKVEEIQPTATGTITVTLNPGTNNNNGSKYYYINAMWIHPAK